MAMPTQATVNSKLAGYVESPITAAFISFAVGTVALFVYMLLTGVPLSSLASSKDAPLVAWIGGFLGAFFVSVMATVVPRIGVALAFSSGDRRANARHAFDRPFRLARRSRKTDKSLARSRRGADHGRRDIDSKVLILATNNTNNTNYF